jgi:hypothetical protein
LVSFLKNPSPESAEPKPAETPWSEEPSAVNHLTDSTFDAFIAENPSVLVSVQIREMAKYKEVLLSSFS